MLKKRRPSEILCRMDVTGFLSIMVVLLYTMITVALYPAPRHTVSRVPADHSVQLPRADREDAIIVAVLRDGKIYLDRQLIMNGPELADQLRDRVRAGAEKKVYINVDARAHYRNVNQVLNQVRLAGIEKVAFLTETHR
jgi:biopolymer transport protein TolR